MNVDSQLIQGIRRATVCAVGFSMAFIGFVLVCHFYVLFYQIYVH